MGEVRCDQRQDDDVFESQRLRYPLVKHHDDARLQDRGAQYENSDDLQEGILQELRNSRTNRSWIIRLAMAEWIARTGTPSDQRAVGRVHGPNCVEIRRRLWFVQAAETNAQPSRSYGGFRREKTHNGQTTGTKDLHRELFLSEVDWSRTWVPSPLNQSTAGILGAKCNHVMIPPSF